MIIGTMAAGIVQRIIIAGMAVARQILIRILCNDATPLDQGYLEL